MPHPTLNGTYGTYEAYVPYLNLSKQGGLSEQSSWLNNIVSIFYISRNFVHFVYYEKTQIPMLSSYISPISRISPILTDN